MVTSKRTLSGIAAVVFAGAMLSGPAASASTTIHYGVHATRIHGCYAALDAKHTGSHWYARARFYRSSVTCYGWLERAKRGGSWRRISYIYEPNRGHWRYTGWHGDSYPYRARACAMDDTFVTRCTSSF